MPPGMARGTRAPSQNSYRGALGRTQQQRSPLKNQQLSGRTSTVRLGTAVGLFDCRHSPRELHSVADPALVLIDEVYASSERRREGASRKPCRQARHMRGYPFS